ncbi:unnamed protein product [Penicillium bialowiezense]
MIPVWIMIAWVFNERDILSRVLAVATDEGKDAFSTDGLPIPPFIKDGIDRNRASYLQGVLLAVENHTSRLLSTKVCSFRPCNTAYLGALMVKLAELNIFFRPVRTSESSPLKSTTIQLTGLSPSMIRSMVKEGERGLELAETCDLSSCSSYHYPWGERTHELASKTCAELMIPEI